jgi:hypothetical protein
MMLFPAKTGTRFVFYPARAAVPFGSKMTGKLEQEEDMMSGLNCSGHEADSQV